MGPTIPLRNIVGKTVDVLLIGIIPLQGRLNGQPVLFREEIEDFLKKRRLVLIEIFNKRPDAPFKFKVIGLIVTVIPKGNGHPRIEERQLP